MPAFLRKYSLSMLSIVTLSAVILPTAIAVLLAHWLVMQRVSESVTRLARQTVARADTVSAEMKQANRLFAQLAGQDPCGTDGIRMMRKAMLHSDTLTDVGHVKDNRLRCSGACPIFCV